MEVARIAGLALAFAVAQSLAGCSAQQVCVSWVDFESPADAAADADLVVTGTVVGTDGTSRLYGVDATMHRVAVDRVIKGELDADELLVASTPETCTGDRGVYPNGDPLAVEGGVQLFLDRDGGVWRTLTPFDGVVPAPADGTLPWDGSEADE